MSRLATLEEAAAAVQADLLASLLEVRGACVLL
jgi:hypothetical protein